MAVARHRYKSPGQRDFTLYRLYRIIHACSSVAPTEINFIRGIYADVLLNSLIGSLIQLPENCTSDEEFTVQTPPSRPSEPKKMAFSLAVAAALAVALPVSVVEGYPTGAPVSACTEMFPNHRMNHENASLPDVRYSSQNLSTAPYRITADVQGNGKVKVSLRVTNESKYWEGFFLQARVQGTTTPVGMWEGLPTNAQTRDCPSGTKTAVTHKSETKTTTLEVTWTPPAAPATMIVVFRGTFVKEFEDFWVGLESDALAVNAYVSASVRLRSLTTVVMGTALLTIVVFMF